MNIMKKCNYIKLCLLFILLSGFLFGQNKKDIKKYKIKSVTETITPYTNGQESSSYKNSYTTYTKDGKITNDTHFFSDGSVKRKETFTYDKNGNKTEETKYDAETKVAKEGVNKKITYKYDADNNEVEEVECDGSGKVIRKSTFLYSSLGEKTTEFELDGATNTVKKHTYSYDSKGLKIESKVYNDKNVLESVKKYTYEF